MQKGYGIGSGISLFMAANACENVVWKAFAPVSIQVRVGLGWLGLAWLGSVTLTNHSPLVRFFDEDKKRFRLLNHNMSNKSILLHTPRKRSRRHDRYTATAASPAHPATVAPANPHMSLHRQTAKGTEYEGAVIAFFHLLFTR